MKDGFITIELGGKQRSLKFNMRAIEAFSEVKNTGAGNLSASTVLIYAGLIGWYYANQQETDFTFSDVADWVEDLIYSGKENVLEQVNECLTNSRAFQYFKGAAKKKVKAK